MEEGLSDPVDESEITPTKTDPADLVPVDESVANIDAVAEVNNTNNDGDFNISLDHNDITLPDIALHTIEYHDFNGRETVDDSSSLTTSFPFPERDERLYPLAGYPTRDRLTHHEKFDRNRPQQQDLYPQYQVADRVFSSYGYPEEPKRILSGQYDQQHQWPAHNQTIQQYGLPQPFNQSGNTLYQQTQETLQTSAPVFQPRFNPSIKRCPTPNTSFQRQKRIEADGIGIPPVTRYCCGLFRTRKSCRLVCIPILLLLLITAGVLGYFLYPHTVDIAMISSLYQTGDVVLSGDFKQSNMKLTVQLFGNFSAHSPNHIPYPAHISVTGSLINPNDKSSARVASKISTSLKAEKQIYASPGQNSFQLLLKYTYAQTTVNYTKNLIRQVSFKEVDGDLQALYLSCAPELIGVLPYPNRKPKTLTVKLGWRVEVSINGLHGGVERDIDCPEGVMRLLRSIAEELT